MSDDTVLEVSTNNVSNIYFRPLSSQPAQGYTESEMGETPKNQVHT